ncbi:hypothetical protein BYT27DRAFT_7113948 [Phlegmacium glaucopus]|nr:hypothetical protein BYT27DRAFT_7113948 [Phlegmacium glaucopus]
MLVTEDVFAPPVLISPIKQCQRQAAPTINRLTDLEVWEMSDEEIVDAARMSWRSEVYDHYHIC